MDDNNIPYWLYHGTLLGVIRDKNIIDGDDDADCCIPESYVDKLMSLKDYCVDHGYELQHHDGTLKYIVGIPIGENFCRIIDKSTKLHLDIGLAFETNGFLSDPCTDIPNTLRQTWRYDTIFPLRQINIFGKTFSIPNDYDTVNFATYNDDCYTVRKSSSESLAAEDHHNNYTKKLLR